MASPSPSTSPLLRKKDSDKGVIKANSRFYSLVHKHEDEILDNPDLLHIVHRFLDTNRSTMGLLDPVQNCLRISLLDLSLEDPSDAGRLEEAQCRSPNPETEDLMELSSNMKELLKIQREVQEFAETETLSSGLMKLMSSMVGSVSVTTSLIRALLTEPDEDLV